jgi:hypothetical protein
VVCIIKQNINTLISVLYTECVEGHALAYWHRQLSQLFEVMTGELRIVQGGTAETCSVTCPQRKGFIRVTFDDRGGHEIDPRLPIYIPGFVALNHCRSVRKQTGVPKTKGPDGSGPKVDGDADSPWAMAFRCKLRWSDLRGREVSWSLSESKWCELSWSDFRWSEVKWSGVEVTCDVR